MGKYGASLIHEWFSDWHIQKCKPNAYLSDQDRVWVESRYGKIVAVFDLKWQWNFESGLDAQTYSEKIIMDFFEQHGVPSYLVIIDPRFEKPSFQVKRPSLNLTVTLTEEGFIKWIDADLDRDKLPKPIENLAEVLS